MAKNTGRGTRAGKSDGTFLNQKRVGGSFGKKPFLCKIGFHRFFNDTVGENIGSEENPFWYFTTYQTCDKCEYTTKPVAS